MLQTRKPSLKYWVCNIIFTVIFQHTFYSYPGPKIQVAHCRIKTKLHYKLEKKIY